MRDALSDLAVEDRRHVVAALERTAARAEAAGHPARARAWRALSTTVASSGDLGLPPDVSGPQGPAGSPDA
jgi:hypothetical protein